MIKLVQDKKNNIIKLSLDICLLFIVKAIIVKITINNSTVYFRIFMYLLYSNLKDNRNPIYNANVVTPEKKDCS